MLATIGGGCQLVNGFKGLVEAPLLLIAAFKGNGFDGIVGLNEAPCGPIDPLTDHIGMDSRLDQFVEACL